MSHETQPDPGTSQGCQTADSFVCLFEPDGKTTNCRRAAGGPGQGDMDEGTRALSLFQSVLVAISDKQSKVITTELLDGMTQKAVSGAKSKV